MREETRRLVQRIGQEEFGGASADRFRRYAPEIALSASEMDELQRVLSQMLIA